jgi:hypothetical protein
VSCLASIVGLFCLYNRSLLLKKDERKAAAKRVLPNLFSRKYLISLYTVATDTRAYLSSVATDTDRIKDGSQGTYQNETCHPDTQFCVTAIKGNTVWRGCGKIVCLCLV